MPFQFLFQLHIINLALDCSKHRSTNLSWAHSYILVENFQLSKPYFRTDFNHSCIHSLCWMCRYMEELQPLSFSVLMWVFNLLCKFSFPEIFVVKCHWSCYCFLFHVDREKLKIFCSLQQKDINFVFSNGMLRQEKLLQGLVANLLSALVLFL